MRSILPKGESRKRRSIAARAIACILVALLALPFAGCSASPNATGGTAGSQEYTVSVSLSGGSGRASIASPTTIVKDGDTYTATITWSSSNYDKMTADGVDYAPVNDGGNSTFKICLLYTSSSARRAAIVMPSGPPGPIPTTKRFPITADKVADGTYPITVDSSSNMFKIVEKADYITKMQMCIRDRWRRSPATRRWTCASFPA